DPPDGSSTLGGRGEVRSRKPSRLFTVWYGTNRKPVDSNDLSRGFTAFRGGQNYFGTCEVVIPRSHKPGSVGSRFWKRWATLTDDRLRVARITGLSELQFWMDVEKVLAGLEPDDRQALVFLHGYNTSFINAAIRAAQLGFDLRVPGLTAFYSWPSEGREP